MDTSNNLGRSTYHPRFKDGIVFLNLTRITHTHRYIYMYTHMDIWICDSNMTQNRGISLAFAPNLMTCLSPVFLGMFRSLALEPCGIVDNVCSFTGGLTIPSQPYPLHLMSRECSEAPFHIEGVLPLWAVTSITLKRWLLHRNRWDCCFI